MITKLSEQEDNEAIKYLGLKLQQFYFIFKFL